MNDYKELIYALKSCQHIASNCIDCPLSNTKYYNYKTKECEVHLHNVAADVIEQLVKERDAAVADLKSELASECGLNPCRYCKYQEDDYQCPHDCIPYSEKWGWQWRGVQEVDDD